MTSIGSKGHKKRLTCRLSIESIPTTAPLSALGLESQGLSGGGLSNKMPFPSTIIRERDAAGPIGSYARLSEPVILITATRGREVFTSARALFTRIAEIGQEIRNGAPVGTLLAIWQGGEFMATATGLDQFNRASKAQRGGARALGTKYQWYFLSEYLGWEWQRN